MIRHRLRLAALFVLAALAALAAVPAAAQSFCQPPRGQAMTVVGVAANDTLNIRKAPGADQEIVARLANGTRGVIATGRVRFTRDSCAVSCTRLLDGVPGLSLVLEADCLRKGRIWYEVREPRGKLGWASAQFLRLGGGTPPPPPPAKDVIIRFICQSNERLDVTLRARQGDARVITGDGLDLILPRRRSTPEIDYAAREFGGISLTGSVKRVFWIGPGQPETLCVPRS